MSEIEVEGENTIPHEVTQESSDASTTDAPDAAQADVKPKDELILSANGEILWNDNIVARLIRGEPAFEPKLELIGEELNREETSKVVFERLNSWLDEQMRSELYPLYRLKYAIDFVGSQEEANEEINNEASAPIETTEAASTDTTAAAEPAADAAQTQQDAAKPKSPKLPLSDIAKSIAQKIYDARGILDRSGNEKLIHDLSQDNRRELRNFGVKFGRSAIYLPLLLKPKAARINAVLHAVATGRDDEIFIPRMGVTSFNAEGEVAQEDYLIAGFKNIAGRVVRLDILDRVLDALFDAAKEAKGPIAMPIAVVSLLGVSNEIAANVVEGLGWEKTTDEEGNVKYALPRRKFTPRPRNDNHRNEGENGEKRFEKRFDNKSRPPQQNQGFGKKRKDKGEKFKRNNDYRSPESKDNSDSPFAILAKLKDNMGE